MIEVTETTFPLLTLMVALPALGALAIGLFPPLRAAARTIGLIVSLVVLALAVYAVATFDFSAGGKYQFAETYPWIPQIGTSWALGVNGLGLAMVVLSALLVPIVFMAAPSDGVDDSDGGYVALTLAAEAFMVLIFAARDVFLFYVAFEAMLIPMYFLIGRYGRGENRRRSAIKFLLYSLAGGLVMLIGVVALYVYSPVEQGQFLLENATSGLKVGKNVEMLMFLTFFFAFAVKAPMVPVHTWLADTAEVARPGTSTLLVGVMDKIGTFSMITLCLTIFPNASHAAALPIVVVALVSILWGAFAALAQKDLMRLVSFTSVSHFGLMVMGIFIGNETALTGAMIYMVAHGLSIAGLFLIGGFLTRRAGTQEIGAYGGMQQVTPVLAGTFLVSGLAAIALPGLSGFVPELMVLIGSFSVAWWAGFVAVLAVVAAALYVLLPYQRIFTGAVNEDTAQVSDLNNRERWAVVAPLIVLMLAMGFFPKPLVDAVSPIAQMVVPEQMISEQTTKDSAKALSVKESADIAQTDDDSQGKGL